MLPDAHNSPTGIFKHLIHPSVTLTIAGNFLPPEIGVGLWNAAVLAAAVPVTTIEKNADPLAAEDEVGANPQAGFGLYVDAVPKPKSVQRRA